MFSFSSRSWCLAEWQTAPTKRTWQMGNAHSFAHRSESTTQDAASGRSGEDGVAGPERIMLPGDTQSSAHWFGRHRSCCWATWELRLDGGADLR